MSAAQVKVGVVTKFVQVKSPTNALVTKFGGLPVWVSEAEWPVSKVTKEKLAFIGQINLETDWPLYDAKTCQAKMAYLFMNPDEDADSFDPDEGENAVIVQPGNNAFYEFEENDEIGPVMTHSTDTTFNKEGLCEFDVEIDIRDEQESPDGKEKFLRIMIGEKDQVPSHIQDQDISAVIGGIPAWIQCEDSPYNKKGQFLCQLEEEIPFNIEFGYGGSFYAFLNDTGSEGKCLWQR